VSHRHDGLRVWLLAGARVRWVPGRELRALPDGLDGHDRASGVGAQDALLPRLRLALRVHGRRRPRRHGQLLVDRGPHTQPLAHPQPVRAPHTTHTTRTHHDTHTQHAHTTTHTQHIVALCADDAITVCGVCVCSTRVVFPPCDTTQFQEIELDVAQRNNVIMSLGTPSPPLSLSLSHRRVVLPVAHAARSNVDSPVPRGEGPQAAGAGVRAPAAEPHLHPARVGRLRAPAARRRLPRTRRPAGETPTLDPRPPVSIETADRPRGSLTFTFRRRRWWGGGNSCWTRWRPWPRKRAWGIAWTS